MLDRRSPFRRFILEFVSCENSCRLVPYTLNEGRDTSCTSTCSHICIRNTNVNLWMYTRVVDSWAISRGKRKWGGSGWIVSNPWDRILGLRSSRLGIPAVPLIIQSRKYLIHRVGFEGLFTRRILQFINDRTYITVTYFLKARVQLMLNKLRGFQCGVLETLEISTLESRVETSMFWYLNVSPSLSVYILIRVYISYINKIYI